MHLSRAISLLEAGDRLAVSYPDPTKAADRTRYFLVENGGGLTVHQYRSLLPRLIPVGDGLFGESQSFALGPEPEKPARKPRQWAS